RENSVSNESAPTFDQFFELNDLKAQLQEKDTTIKQLKERVKDLRKNPDWVKKEYDAIETINIELEHSVAKLLSENENFSREIVHLKQIFKEQFDSIKKSCVSNIEHNDSLVAQMNLKSVENADFQVQIHKKILAIEVLENELKIIKGKHVVDSVTPKPKVFTIAQGMSKVAFEPLPPKLFKNKEAYIDYIHKSRENATVLREIVEEVRASNPLDGELDLACKYAERIQEELVCVHDTCPCLATPKERLIAFTQKNKDSKTKPANPVISSQHREKLVVGSSKTPDSNMPVLPSIGLKSSTKVCRSQPSGNKRNDRIPQPQHSNLKNTVEAQHRKPTLSANKKNHVKTSVCDANIKHTMLNANSELMCVKCNQCMFDANHDACFLKYVSDMNVRSKPKSVKNDKIKEEWKPTGHVFTKVGFQWRPIGRKFSFVRNVFPLTRITTTKEMPLRKTIPLAVTEQTHVATRIYTRKPNVPIIVGSNRKAKVVQIVLWYLDFGFSKHMIGDRSQLTNFIAKFLGTVKFVGQFCDLNLEVAFRKHTCFVRNLEGVDLLLGSRGTNLYTISIGDMLSSSPICLLSKASKTKSWLWHCYLLHLNFGAINHLARHGLIRGLPKLKFEKDHLCSACALGKSKKHSHKPKADDTNQEKLFLLHMDLYGPMRFVNQTLRDYYESVGISHETSIARTPQQNGVVERRNRTLFEATRTMLIYAKAQLFLWAKAVATACYTQNHSIVRLRHGKTPYELLHDKKPDLSYIHVFGALCYPTNDSENLAMASKRSSLEPAFHEMTPATPSSGLVPNPPSTAPFVPPTRKEWDIVFQPVFDEFFNPPTNVDFSVPADEILNHDLEVAHISNDPYFGIPFPETILEESSSSDANPPLVHPDAPVSEHISRWTKDHPLHNIIGEISRPVSIRLQLYKQALFCYYDAFLTAVEPKTYKDALTQSCWIEAMQEKLHEFERLEVWELVPRPDKVMVITLKCIYKVKLDELGGILKNKARLVARGYRQEE
ncbi:retrovirus-related pol polyprotein from transposon TNT 1-94, partial [Tanacetum coccineum]